MPSARFSMLDRAPQQSERRIDATAETRPVKFRGGGFVPSTGRYGGWTAPAAAIAPWQVAGSTSRVNPLFLPAPLAIVRAVYELALSGALCHDRSRCVVR